MERWRGGREDGECRVCGKKGREGEGREGTKEGAKEGGPSPFFYAPQKSKSKYYFVTEEGHKLNLCGREEGRGNRFGCVFTPLS